MLWETVAEFAEAPKAEGASTHPRVVLGSNHGPQPKKKKSNRLAIPFPVFQLRFDWPATGKKSGPTFFKAKKTPIYKGVVCLVWVVIWLGESRGMAGSRIWQLSRYGKQRVVASKDLWQAAE